MGIRETLDSLYASYYSQKDIKARESISFEINKILSRSCSVDNLYLFLSQNHKKKYYEVLNRLLIGDTVDDCELARSLSSLLNHLIEQVALSTTNYNDLHVNEVSTLLNQFLLGEIDREKVKDFFIKYL